MAGPVKSTFFSTGTKALENAIKIARAYTGRPGGITFGGCFHGCTLLTLALTGKVAPYKLGFGPLPGQIFHAQYPNALHEVSVAQALASVERLFCTDIAADQVAEILFEPVQGEGGFNIAPPEFLIGLRALCDRHGILLIADEVQSGFGRTGKLFALDHCPSVKADIVTMAKSLGGGLPISGVAGRAEVMDAPAPGGLVGTYAGNPLAVLEVIEEQQLCARAALLGGQLQETPREMQRHCPAIADVSGLGSMVAVEFSDPAKRAACCCLRAAYPAAGAGPGTAADLRRGRQRDLLLIPAHHSRSAIHCGAGAVVHAAQIVFTLSKDLQRDTP